MTRTETRRAELARRESVFADTLQFMDLASVAVDERQPHWLRRRLQRRLRSEQRAIAAELDAWRDPDGSGRRWSADEPARYVDRYLESCLRRRRASRRAPPHTPWGRLLEDWTPERRCAHAFAVDALGATVHHDDPAAVRWCLGGWLAHRCQKPSTARPHRVSRERWWDRSNDRDARRLLNEVWALVPERTRSAVERLWRARTTAAERKRLDQHPLGYWWFLAPHLAERWLQIEPGRLPPLTLEMLTAARDLNVPIR